MKHLLTLSFMLLMASCSAGDDIQSTKADLDLSHDTSDGSMSLQAKSTQTEAQKITDGIYKATGFGNTFLVVTEAGNVIIDTSLARSAKAHKALLMAVDDEEAKYIIITHGHGDHTGGIPFWKGANTEVIAHKNIVEFAHYQNRLRGFFSRQNAYQFGFSLSELPSVNDSPGNYTASIPATILTDEKYTLELGNKTLEIIATPAETLDAISVWIPEDRTVFVGDLYYESFPNIYTLRGTKPRWSLDYVSSLNKILALDAEILVPSHGEPIKGAAEVKAALTHYRDAILYVHDATVKGMNEGKDVYTLMEEIRLPKDLELPEIYGTIAWSVRGIFEGYIGWFDGNPSTMLGISPTRMDGKLVQMAGGPDVVAREAKKLKENGQTLDALALADNVLAFYPEHIGALSVRLSVLKELRAATQNYNESGWLSHGIREAEKALK